MKYTPYSKPFQTPSQIVDKLIADGLIVNNIPYATKVLENINYFRFKIYLRPFLDLQTKKFLLDTTFEQAYELYCFDEELRNNLFGQISQIEIRLRTLLDQDITGFTKNPFWYLDDSLFIYSFKITTTRVSLRNEFQRSKDDFALHYKDRYFNEQHNDFKDMAPFWLISELATFGNILSIFDSLDKKPFRLEHNENVLDKLSEKFGAKNLKELNSWLKLIRDVRNRVAHHSRVWNCNYREPHGIRVNLDDSIKPAKANKIYFLFLMFEILYDKGILSLNIKDIVSDLIIKYPTVDMYLDSMGIPKDWLYE
jgi:abortive infection bacteriophage resistance protein